MPWRGLWEILRFGSLKPLMPIFRQHRITDEDVKKLTKTETPENGKASSSRIARDQEKREALHDQ